MPEFVSFETDTIEKAEAFEFDDPGDERRYFSGGDNQIAGVGDGFERDSPPWIKTNAFALECLRAQIRAADGLTS